MCVCVTCDDLCGRLLASASSPSAPNEFKSKFFFFCKIHEFVLFSLTFLNFLPIVDLEIYLFIYI